MSDELYHVWMEWARTTGTRRSVEEDAVSDATIPGPPTHLWGDTYTPEFHLAMAIEGYRYEYTIRFGPHFYHMFEHRDGRMRAVAANYPEEPVNHGT